jgi:hypothetical protein
LGIGQSCGIPGVLEIEIIRRLEPASQRRFSRLAWPQQGGHAVPLQERRQSGMVGLLVDFHIVIEISVY